MGYEIRIDLINIRIKKEHVELIKRAIKGDLEDIFDIHYMVENLKVLRNRFLSWRWDPVGKWYKEEKFAVWLGICLIFVFLLHACAFDVIHVRQSPCQIEKCESNCKSFKLGKEIQITLDTGYSRKLKNGIRWDYVGVIPRGEVFKTNEQILTLEGSNIFEAYIVVSSGKLVGFYLPVEKAFSSISDPIELEMIELKHIQ